MLNLVVNLSMVHLLSGSFIYSFIKHLKRLAWTMSSTAQGINKWNGVGQGPWPWGEQTPRRWGCSAVQQEFLQLLWPSLYRSLSIYSFYQPDKVGILPSSWEEANSEHFWHKQAQAMSTYSSCTNSLSAHELIIHCVSKSKCSASVFLRYMCPQPPSWWLQKEKVNLKKRNPLDVSDIQSTE